MSFCLSSFRSSSISKAIYATLDFCLSRSLSICLEMVCSSWLLLLYESYKLSSNSSILLLRSSMTSAYRARITEMVLDLFFEGGRTALALVVLALEFFYFEPLLPEFL